MILRLILHIINSIKSADRLEKELGKKYPTAVTYEEIDGIDYVNGIERKYCFS
jgi:hypothetical protein